MYMGYTLERDNMYAIPVFILIARKVLNLGFTGNDGYNMQLSMTHLHPTAAKMEQQGGVSYKECFP